MNSSECVIYAQQIMLPLAVRLRASSLPGEGYILHKIWHVLVDSAVPGKHVIAHPSGWGRHASIGTYRILCKICSSVGRLDSHKLVKYSAPLMRAWFAVRISHIREEFNIVNEGACRILWTIRCCSWQACDREAFWKKETFHTKYDVPPTRR